MKIKNAGGILNFNLYRLGTPTTTRLCFWRKKLVLPCVRVMVCRLTPWLLVKVS